MYFYSNTVNQATENLDGFYVCGIIPTQALLPKYLGDNSDSEDQLFLMLALTADYN